MTREEAIEYWEQFNAEIDNLYDTCSDAERDTLVKQREAVEFTISALRAQQDAAGKNICGCTNLECSLCAPGPCEHRKQPNTPLTLDELREMDGEPVWWWNASAKPVCMICVFDRFMAEPMFANYDFVSEDTVKLTKYKWLKKCGYKPYRRKPEEGTT